MNVAVIGANGKIGTHLMEQLQQAKKHVAVAMVRSQTQVDAWQEKGHKAQLFDLESPVETLQDGLTGFDAIVFTAGSGASTGNDKTLLVDLDGAAKTIEAAEHVGVKRFVMVSAWQAQERDNWNEQLKAYYVAKHHADRILVASSLAWTIVRPGALIDEPATGKVKLGSYVEADEIPRSDVAHILRRCLDDDNVCYKAFDAVQGDEEIEHALQAL